MVTSISSGSNVVAAAAAVAAVVICGLVSPASADRGNVAKKRFEMKFDGEVRRTAVSDNGRYAAAIFHSRHRAEQNRLRVIDLKSRALLIELSVEPIEANKYDWRTPHPEHNVLAFTRDNKSLLYYAKGHLVIRDLTSDNTQGFELNDILHVVATRKRKQFLVRSRESISVFDTSDGETRSLLELPCSADNYCKEVSLVRGNYAYFSYFEGRELARCHLKKLECEKTSLPTSGHYAEMDILPGGKHIVMDSDDGLAAYAIDRDFDISDKPNKVRRFKNEITLVVGLDSKRFINGRRYYFVGFLTRKGFRAVTEWDAPSSQETATHASLAGSAKRGVIGTTKGRLIVFSH